MKVCMLGWEFPPFISGGLGTACYGLTRGLDNAGVSVLFVLPRCVDQTAESHVEILTPATPKRARPRSAATDGAPDPREQKADAAVFRRADFRVVAAALNPYARPEEATEEVFAHLEPLRLSLPFIESAGGIDLNQAVAAAQQTRSGSGPQARPDSIAGPGADYAGDLFAEVQRYAQAACQMIRDEEFDLVHAHDWMTYPAGMAVSALSGKPLVVHVHSTEFDRSGIHVNQRIYDIERAGMHAASRVICVSYLTRTIVINRYGVDPRRVVVVHNAVNDNEGGKTLPPITKDDKIVLFLGRITMQKGPEYFLRAAKRVLEVMDNVRFIMAGSGDMIRRVIEMSAEMGIGHRVLFTGFLRGDDIRRAFRMADLYVMPSVSEPFGITPLEALSNEVPVLISKQSGVAEILSHALKVDFWDIDEMANKIIAVLRHPPLHATLRDHGSMEVRSFSWNDSAAACVKVYEAAVNGPAN